MLTGGTHLLKSAALSQRRFLDGQFRGNTGLKVIKCDVIIAGVERCSGELSGLVLSKEQFADRQEWISALTKLPVRDDA